MSFLGSNIRFLRKEKRLTQEELSGRIGVKRSLVGAYEEGRAEPKIRTILALCHYFNVSADAIINEDLQHSGYQAHDMAGKGLRVLSIAVDKEEDKELCTVVPIKASAGYTKGYGDTEYIGSLPKFNMPYEELSPNQTYRLFQISGDSMLPLPSGSYVICEYLQDWTYIKPGECYMFVTKDEGITYKRTGSSLEEGGIVLKSDNPEYEPYTLPVSQITEVWKALGYTSFELPGNEVQLDMFGCVLQKLDRLTEDVDYLKKQMDRKK